MAQIEKKKKSGLGSTENIVTPSDIAPVSKTPITERTIDDPVEVNKPDADVPMPNEQKEGAAVNEPNREQIPTPFIEEQKIEKRRGRKRYNIVEGEKDSIVTIEVLSSVYIELDVRATRERKSMKQYIGDILFQYIEKGCNPITIDYTSLKNKEFQKRNMGISKSVYLKLFNQAKDEEKSFKQLINEILYEYYANAITKQI